MIKYSALITIINITINKSKILVILSLLLTLIPAESYAQRNGDNLTGFCEGVFNLCGYKDKNTKEVVIPNIFERIMDFHEGLAAVRIKGLFGYIDLSGKIIIEPKYDLAGSFYQGLAEILVEGKTGIINKNGEIVIKPQFARSIPFTKDVVLVKSGTWHRSYYHGREKLPSLSDSAFSFSYGLYGLYHIKDGWIAKPQFYLNLFERQGRGLIWASKKDHPSEKLYGLLRSDGSWKIPPTYSHAQRLTEDGMAIVSIGMKNGRQKHWGAVNSEGDLVIPVKYAPIVRWYYGFSRYNIAGKEYSLDIMCLIVNKPNIDKVKPTLTLLKKLGLDHLIDTTLCKTGKYFNSKGLWGVKGPNGDIVIKPVYRAIGIFYNGVFWVPIDKEKQWCPIGIDGKRLEGYKCQRKHYSYTKTDSVPERFHKDPYENSVLWSRAHLEYLSGKRKNPPKWISSGP